ncbi:MAG: type I secretion C-terminal target domain-containing protein [Fischerella sp.]|jgi:Ca2+-binding RTX toxin-like protein|uniref:choice-of-anchor Q domain-containing protein n=1 Tax=Fischerella sp. TaxID=1191 RepID=UPI0017E3F984|nr:choice-of-anchor Q domain-containing protein [Fischerella sp.]NWF61080.1 type I secretion C-terminal target domain-containing protein [Fischerella sp.]
MAIIEVTTAADSGEGSLRAAIASAEAGDTIKFASNLSNQTIKLSSGDLKIMKDLTIDGAGATNLTISGENASRVFDVTRKIKVAFKNLNIANGKTTEAGGAINVDYDTNITIENCQFKNNKAGIGGAVRLGYNVEATVQNSKFDGNDGTLAKSNFSAGAIATNGGGELTIKGSEFTNNKGVNGGAVYKLMGDLSVENSSFLNNSSKGGLGGGAILIDGANQSGPSSTEGGQISIRGSHFEGNETEGEGGAIMSWGYGLDKMLVEDTTIVGNSAKTGEIKGRGGALRVHGELTLRNVSIANNTADNQGGGLWSDGQQPVEISNSTFSGNKAIGDAGGAMILNSHENAPVNIVNTTIVKNDAGRASGAIWFGHKNKPVKLTNSIVAHNTSGTRLQQQVVFELQDGGGNIEWSDDKIANQVVAGSKKVDPLVGDLQNIDGHLVHKLASNSPAINVGKKGTGIPTIDQLGVERDGTPDAGAFEVASSKPAEVLSSNSTQPSTSSGQNQSNPNSTSTVMGTSLIKGDERNDNLKGSESNEKLVGNNGGDTINGNGGNDVLLGGNDNDFLSGGTGQDILIGGNGKDVLIGGAGKDKFSYENFSQRGDTVFYFEPTKDVIDISKVLNGSTSSNRKSFQEYVQLKQVGSDTVVSVDVDGSLNRNNFQELLKLKNFTANNLTENNFVL